MRIGLIAVKDLCQEASAEGLPSFFLRRKSGKMKLVAKRIQMSVDIGKVNKTVAGGSEVEKMGANT